MIEYVFRKPFSISELENEMRTFARLVAEEGFDTVSGLVIYLQPTLEGEPFEYRRADS